MNNKPSKDFASFEIALNNFLKCAELPLEIIDATDAIMFGDCTYLELRVDGKNLVHEYFDRTSKDSLVLDLPSLDVGWKEWENCTIEGKMQLCKEGLEDIISEIRRSFDVYKRANYRGHF